MRQSMHLKNGDEDVVMMREQYDGRRRYVLHRFEEMGLPCFEPHGAFYTFPVYPGIWHDIG